MNYFKTSRFLQKVSIGKYQTTLYNKSGNFYKSSSIGGIITILIGIALASVITFMLINVFEKTDYILENSE